MKIKLIKKLKNKNNTLSLKEIKEEDGVYQSIKGMECSRVLSECGELYFVDTETECFEPLVECEWTEDRFIKTDEILTVTFGDEG